MSDPIWDTDESVDFLKKWSLNGPWAITAISPVDKTLIGEVFKPGQEKQLHAYLHSCGEKELNVYFHVNTVKVDKFKKKAKREHIDRVTHFHVDIDPRAKEDLGEEQKRIERSIETLPDGVPEPTWVIFSGGGYQLFWELAEPIEIGGSVSEAESAKLYNLQLEVMFEGDNCHNIDRIMRLPGTINVPDEKKKRKGRKKAKAYVVKFSDQNIYPVGKFTQASQAKVGTGFDSAEQIVIPGNLQRASGIPEILTWVEESGGVLPDFVQVLIVQGDDPNEPDKYEGRSEALHACVCWLVRAKLTDTQIYTIITDPDFEISASILDKGSSIERYAKRQIDRARQKVKNPEMLKMNDKHAVIGCFGGRCVVVQELWDANTKRFNLVKQSIGDFTQRYRNKKVSLGKDADGIEKFAQLGKWWLDHEDRRQYTNVVFAPNTSPEDAYNLWQGFAVESNPNGSCGLFLQHMKSIICGGNQGYYDYLLNWMARAVQEPNKAGESAVILRGKRGTGKSIFVKHFGALFGRHFLQVSDPNHIVGNFNQHLRDCIILFGDEAFFAGDKKHEGTLKTLITEEHMAVTAKGYDTEMTSNFLHLLMASNSDWVVPAGMEERRFFVLDVKDTEMKNISYFKALSNQMYNGGREALLHLLKTIDLEEFDHRTVPDTEALYEQKQLSMTAEHEWWYDKIIQGALLPEAEGSWTGRATLDAMHEDYANYLQRLGVYRKQTKTTLGKFLKKITPMAYPKRHLVSWPNRDGGESQQYVWDFPSLVQCREYWDEHFFIGEWPTGVETRPPDRPF